MTDEYIINFKGHSINVDKNNAYIYLRTMNTLLFGRIISFFLILGAIGYLIAYIYYSFSINNLLDKPSKTCPTFTCSSKQNKIPCQGKAYHVDKSTGKIICLN